MASGGGIMDEQKHKIDKLVCCINKRLEEEAKELGVSIEELKEEIFRQLLELANKDTNNRK
jgi:hypothetical protein